MMRLILVFCSLLFSMQLLAADGWTPVKDVSLMIEPGSILDFSALTPADPIKSRLIVNSAGQLVRQDDPQKPQHFLMASLGFSVYSGGFPSHEMTDLYMQQLRLHGYNMARLDFIEATLMEQRKVDFDFDPEQLDRLFYLLAALKNNGTYYILNGLSSENAAYGNITQRWLDSKHAKLRIYYDKEMQEHWKKLMQTMLGSINPYTGMTTLNDPAMAGLIMVNEGSLAFVNRITVSDEFRPMYIAWLKKKYGNTVQLSQAWKGELGSDESLEASTVKFPRPDQWTSLRMADTQQFYTELEKSTADWMTKYLRSLGYQGLVTAYNNWLSPASTVSRGQFSWVDLHNYFSEPTNDDGPGSVMRQDSTLQDSAGYIAELMAGRHIGKAYSVSEFGQVFWNKYRRESGLALPAYAAFQNWGVICQHASAISLSYIGLNSRKQAIGPFDVGLDPIARAGETLSALLFVRGDVTPAKHMLGIKLTPKFVYYENAHVANTPRDIARLGLVTGIGIDWQGAKEKSGLYTAQFEPSNSELKLLDPLSGQVIRPMQTFTSKIDAIAREYSGKLAAKITKTSLISDDRWKSRIDALKKSGLIEENNLTGITDGIYQSDTGEILLDAKQKKLTVVTPRTEAVVFDRFIPVHLPTLNIEESDGPALVSVSAMDQQSLGNSQRILLILATDARNSDMHFSDAAETTLLDIGKKPAIIKNAKLRIYLKNKNGLQLKVYSTNLRGQRVDAIASTKDASGIGFALDASRLSHGSTTYFEITSQANAQ